MHLARLGADAGDCGGLAGQCNLVCQPDVGLGLVDRVVTSRRQGDAVVLGYRDRLLVDCRRTVRIKRRRLAAALWLEDASLAEQRDARSLEEVLDCWCHLRRCQKLGM